MPTKDPDRRRLNARFRTRRYRTKHPEAREQNRIYTKAWNDKHRVRVRERDRNHKRKVVAEKILFINAHKARPCIDCGHEFPPCAMDFDHVRGIKRRNVALMKTNSYQTISEEIAKCDLVCANCHRVRTWKRGGMLGRPRKDS